MTDCHAIQTTLCKVQLLAGQRMCMSGMLAVCKMFLGTRGVHSTGSFSHAGRGSMTAGMHCL